MKRSRINPISARRRRDMATYKVLSEEFLEEHPTCAVYPQKRSTQVHHTAGRSGSNYLDVSTWLAVSNDGHRWIHDNPMEAMERGWIRLRS